MTDVGQREADLAPVPAHVAWAGTADRIPDQGEAAGPWARRELAAVTALARGAADMGIEWLTVQVGSGAGALAAELDRQLGPLATVRTLGAPWTPRPPAPSAGRLTVVLADGGQGRSEIVQAVAAMAADGLPPEAVDEKVLAGYLFEPDVPDPDLLVVTGGDRRVPDLLLWEIAYSELLFSGATWPDVDGTHLGAAVDEYRHRSRRYGGIDVTSRSRR